MEYAEDDYLMISGIQPFQILQKTVGTDPYRAASGLKMNIRSLVN